VGIIVERFLETVGLSRMMLGSVGVKSGVRGCWIISVNKPYLRNPKALENSREGRGVAAPALYLLYAPNVVEGKFCELRL
jgi:hypothetical protein